MVKTCLLNVYDCKTPRAMPRYSVPGIKKGELREKWLDAIGRPDVKGK